jgi:hypothetical protein
MLTIRKRIAQSLWRQGYVLNEIFFVSKTHRLILVPNILLLWILGLVHRQESGWRMKMLTGLRMIENIPLQCLYGVHKDNFNFTRSCYRITFNNVCVVRMSF